MYTLMANIFALRHEAIDNEEVGPMEIVKIFSTSNAIFADDYEDTLNVFDPDVVPEQPGVYSTMMVVDIRFITDYWGEVDIDPKIVWHQTTSLKPEEAIGLLEDAGMYDPNKPEDVEWAKRVFKFDDPYANDELLTFLK